MGVGSDLRTREASGRCSKGLGLTFTHLLTHSFCECGHSRAHQNIHKCTHIYAYMCMCAETHTHY